jgi:hypothetical protein
MKKVSVIVLILALTVCMFSTTTSFAQSEKFIGKWVITPEVPDGVISHLTISIKGNGFEVSRTKVPDEKGSGLYDTKNQKLVVIIDGKMLYFTYDSKSDHLFCFESESNKKLFELKKE